jgi:hypothetical protein
MTIPELPLELYYALFGVGLFWAAALCWKDLFRAVGLHGYRCGVHGSEDRPEGDHPAYNDLYKQLVTLGFKPLGAFWERSNCSNNTHVEFAFVSPDRQVRAAVFGLKTVGAYKRVSFMTRFDDDTMVHTTNYQSGISPGPKLIPISMAQKPAAELLAAHCQRVRELARDGRTPQTLSTIDEAAEWARALFLSGSVQQDLTRNSFKTLLNKLMMLGLLPVLCLLRVSDKGRYTAAAGLLLFECLFLTWLQFKSRELMRLAHRAADRGVPPDQFMARYRT